MNVIITGATGMVGKGVLLECLDHRSVEKVLVIGRNPVDVTHPKLEQLIQNDFSDFSTTKEQLAGFDACFLCMGISSVGMKENDYKKITYDYTLALARELFALNPEMTITYVSGEGTDSSEKGKVMWARVKGKTENDLIKLGFKQAFMFRPGFIIPLRGIKSRTKAYQFMYDYFMWLVRLFKTVAPNAVVNTTQVGKAMINCALYGYNAVIIKPKDIIQLADK
ncbi:NAD-dependent epimerase/dehydratase family protein [uncultured Draconibacterium sp.]|uniref:NAD-dependent epimerase/dehydratase family protein n=1 Tax=uncultured Draconibacterium sp. TaxID=1573823 RepID=UPI0029C86BAD|nr:NAD-dependent epimerase/dehydratase family protein [uncultured Draconibacterium sp.]